MSWLARFVSLVFLVLACFALPQSAAAQNSITIGSTTFTISDAVATEGGTARFEITIGSGDAFSLINVSVQYIAGTADLADLGSDRPTTYNNDDPQGIHTIEVPIHDDDTVEEEETFTVRISLASFGSMQATGTITDDDGAPPPPAVDIGIDGASANEGDDIRFTVTLSAALLEPRTLDIGYTAGTGAPTGLVNIAPNRVTVDRSSATGTIAASDDPAEDATVSIANAAAVAEGAGASASLAVSLDTAVDRDVVLDVAYAAGSAVLGDLGSGRPTTVTIDEGSTEATLTVPIVNDVIVEDDETFTVTLTTATAGIGIAAGTATGTITDSDTALVSMQGGTVRADESRPFNYFVRLGAPVSRPVTITWTATGGTATVEDDLQDPRTGTVTFPANDNADRTFTVRAVEDTVEEADETFTVTIEAAGTLPARVTVDPDNDSRTSTIVDNDGSTPPPVVNATIGIDDESVAENGGNAEFTVSLTTAVTGDVVLDVIYEGSVRTPEQQSTTESAFVYAEAGARLRH